MSYNVLLSSAICCSKFSYCLYFVLFFYALYNKFFTNSRTLKCSLDAAKRGFYRAANSIFGKVGRIASEEVIIHLIKCKCMPILLYGLEVLNLNKSQLNSLDFVANRFWWNFLILIMYKLYPTTQTSHRIRKLRPWRPCMMGSSSLGARCRLGQDATNTQVLGRTWHCCHILA